MHMASNTALCSKRNSAFVREAHFLPIPSCALSIHFTVPKLEDARVMHDLSPIAASILCGQLLGMALGNPSASLRDGCPPINSQLIGCFPQCAHDACGRPIHSAIRVNSIDHHVAEDIRLDELCHQSPSLLHIFSPFSESFEVLSDAAGGIDQGIDGTTASVQVTEVVLADEVVNQVVPQQHQFFQFLSCPGEICVRQTQMGPHAERIDVLRKISRGLGGNADLIADNI